MPTRRRRPLNFVARGVSDTLDSTNAFPGAMAALTNLIPNPSTRGQFVPRPAAIQRTNFTGFTSPSQVTAIFPNGRRLYGMLSSQDYPGYDEPFCYDMLAQAFVPISGVTTTLLPVSPPTTGDWTPPQIAIVGERVLVTHPGFQGGTNPAFGWIDISGFTLNTLTGNTTSGSMVIASIAGDGTSNPIGDGIAPGQSISGPGIPAGSFVTAVANGTFSLNTTGNVVISQTLIFNVANVAGLVYGQYVTCSGFPIGTQVISVGTFTLNTTGDITTGSNLLKNVASRAGALVGMKVEGNGIPTGTTILQISGNLITMSAAATQTATGTAVTIDGGNVVNVSQDAYATTGNVPVNFSGGGSITISQAATATANGVALAISGGTEAAPTWYAGNTNTNPLPSVPTGVQQFNTRAYFACGNTVAVSDTLNGTQRSNASFELTLGDNQPITALKGLPLENQVTGGVVQSIMAFKGTAEIFQITGDPAVDNWAQNALNVAIGTLAPNSVVATPQGMAFIAPDGLRFISFTAQIGDPVGAFGTGVSVPFINAQNPSRIAAAYNQNVLRISVQNNDAPGSPIQEWWYDFELEIWTGPHSFPAALVVPFYAVTPFTSGHGFVMVPPVSFAAPALYTSEATPIGNITYVENGEPMQWSWETSLLPDNSQMSMNAVIETAMGFVLPPGQTVTISASNESGQVLDSVTLSGPQGEPTIWGNFVWGQGTWLVMVPLTVWGSFIWGQAPWQERGSYYTQERVAWHLPLVFKQMQISAAGMSTLGFSIGNLYLGYEPLGYMLQQAS